MQALEMFIDKMRNIDAPVVLELGVKRSKPDVCTMHRDWVPHAAEFLGTDFQDGLDVDIVADAHSLSSSVGENRFDGIISCSTFEHIQYPWLASVEICKSLKPGGVVFIQTHQSYPLHAYPYDYWRYTKESLSTLFCEKAGFEILDVMYEFPCDIVSEESDCSAHESYLNVCLLA